MGMMLHTAGGSGSMKARRQSLCAIHLLIALPLLCGLSPPVTAAPVGSCRPAMELEGRWRDLDYLLTRQGNVVGPGFEPGPERREFLQNDCR